MSKFLCPGLVCLRQSRLLSREAIQKPKLASRACFFHFVRLAKRLCTLPKRKNPLILDERVFVPGTGLASLIHDGGLTQSLFTAFGVARLFHFFACESKLSPLRNKKASQTSFERHCARDWNPSILGFNSLQVLCVKFVS